jgi:hypothetical protein
MARNQIQLGEQETDNGWVDEALVEAEEAVDTAQARVIDAAEAVRMEDEESGKAERRREAWRPLPP